MKRTFRDRNQASLRPRGPEQNTAPFIRGQTLFQNRNESVNNALMRNNNLQLSFTQAQINQANLFTFAAVRGLPRPHFAGLNQHQTAWPPRMSGFTLGGPQKLLSMARFLQPGRFSGAVNYRSVANPQRIPSTAQQFQENGRNNRNARFTQQRKYVAGSSSRSTQDHSRHGRNGPLDKNNFFMHRKWQKMPEAYHCGANEFNFSLVTYNMLSDALLYENSYLYEECDQGALGWRYRKEKLLTELLQFDAEILCLQEVDACHYENWFLPKLKEAGYEGVFNQRTGGKPDGCAIFYRPAKFTLVKQKLVKYYTPKVQVLDKDNVGIVLLLKAKTPCPNSGKPFICVANTHLLFNKKRGDIKLAQLAYLFAEINELAVLSQEDNRNKHCPIILCGDLNSLPYSPLYHFLISGQLDYSARSPAVISGQLMPSNTRSGPSARRIRTPLLPWEFGITMNCQWREERLGNSEGNQENSKGRQSGCEQASERNEKWSENAEDGNDFHLKGGQPDGFVEVNGSDMNSKNEKSMSHVESDTHFDFKSGRDGNNDPASNKLNNLKIDGRFTRQPSLGQRDEEFCEMESKRTGTSPPRGFNKDVQLQDHAETSKFECSRGTGCKEMNTSKHSECVKSSPSLPVTKVDGGDFEHKTSDSKIDTNWLARSRSQRNYEVVGSINSTVDIESRNRHRHIAEEPHLDGKWSKDTNVEINDESNEQTSRARTRNSKFDCHVQKIKHDKNGTISIPWQVHSVYSHRFNDGSPEVTTCHSKACCNVDYIFYTAGVAGVAGAQATEHRGHVQVGKLTLLGRLELMRKSDFNNMKLLPNYQFPSDHLSLQARFRLT